MSIAINIQFLSISCVFFFVDCRSRFSSVCLAATAVAVERATIKYACHVLRWSLPLNEMCSHIYAAAAAAVAVAACPMPVSRDTSQEAKPSASISATRCERRKFFIRFCFRKLFSASFVRARDIYAIHLHVCFSFLFRIVALDCWSIWYIYSCATDSRDCLSTLLPHELCASIHHQVVVVVVVVVCCGCRWSVLAACSGTAETKDHFNSSQWALSTVHIRCTRQRDVALGYCVTSYQRQHAILIFKFSKYWASSTVYCVAGSSLCRLIEHIELSLSSAFGSCTINNACTVLPFCHVYFGAQTQ